jgi:hypothetical protein
MLLRPEESEFSRHQHEGTKRKGEKIRMKTNLRKRLLKWCPQPKNSDPKSVIKLSTSRKRSLLLYAVPVAALTLAAVILAFWFSMSMWTPASTPPTVIEVNITVINQGITPISGFNSAFDNVPQGTNLQFNLNFASRNGEPVLMQIENLKINYYNSTVDIKQWINSDPNQYTDLQKNALNYSFNPNPVIVQPGTSNSTILTMNLAQDAPAGQYSFEINTGSAVIQPDGTTKPSGIGVGTFGIMIIVVPKAKS